MGDILDGYLVIATIYSWFTWSKIQAKMGIAVFSSVNYYIISKIVLCLFTGWFIMPIDILIKVIKLCLNKKEVD